MRWTPCVRCHTTVQRTPSRDPEVSLQSTHWCHMQRNGAEFHTASSMMANRANSGSTACPCLLRPDQAIAVHYSAGRIAGV